MRKIEDVTLKNWKSLKEVLELHKKWIEGSEDGRKADLSCENLTDVDFSNLDLRYAILRYADLRGADLTGVDLSYAKLTGTNLRGANLVGACL